MDAHRKFWEWKRHSIELWTLPYLLTKEKKKKKKRKNKNKKVKKKNTNKKVKKKNKKAEEKEEGEEEEEEEDKEDEEYAIIIIIIIITINKLFSCFSKITGTSKGNNSSKERNVIGRKMGLVLTLWCLCV